MTMTKPAAGFHPATYAVSVLDAMADALRAHFAEGPLFDDDGPLSMADLNLRGLDPFAGSGVKLAKHRLWAMAEWVGLEIEQAFIESDWVEVGDATRMPFASNQFDVVATSPTYGNRMADHFAPKDDSKRVSYTFSLREAKGTHIGDKSVQLHPENTGLYQWSFPYWDLHRRAWEETVRVMRPGALMLLNVKDHLRSAKVKELVPQPYIETLTARVDGSKIKARQLVHVCQWHHDELAQLGIEWLRTINVPCPGMRNGANRELRVDSELVLVGRRR